MEKKKGYIMPIAILVVLIVYVVIYTGYVTWSQVSIRQGEYQFNRKIERLRNLKPGSYNGDEYSPLNIEDRRKYVNERKLKSADGKK